MDNLNDDKIKKIFELAKPTYNLTDDYVKQTLTIKELGTTTEVEIPNSSTLTHTSIITSRRTRGGTQTETIIIYTYCPSLMKNSEKVYINSKPNMVGTPENKLKKKTIDVASLNQGKPPSIVKDSSNDIKPPHFGDIGNTVVNNVTYHLFGATRNIRQLTKPLYLYALPNTGFNNDRVLNKTDGIKWDELEKYKHGKACISGVKRKTIKLKDGTEIGLVITPILWTDINIPEYIKNAYKRPEADKCIFHPNRTIEALQRIYYEKYITMMSHDQDSYILPIYYFDIDGELQIYDHVAEVYKALDTEHIMVYNKKPTVDYLYVEGGKLAFQAEISPCPGSDSEDGDAQKCVQSGGICTKAFSWTYDQTTLGGSFRFSDELTVGGSMTEEGEIEFGDSHTRQTRDGFSGPSITYTTIYRPIDGRFTTVSPYFETRLYVPTISESYNPNIPSQVAEWEYQMGIMQETYTEQEIIRAALVRQLDWFSSEFAGEELLDNLTEPTENIFTDSTYRHVYRFNGGGAWACTGCGGDGYGPQSLGNYNPPAFNIGVKYDSHYHSWLVRLAFLRDPDVIPLWDELKVQYPERQDASLFINFVTPTVVAYNRPSDETYEDMYNALWTH